MMYTGGLTEYEFDALHEALSQYVSNNDPDELAERHGPDSVTDDERKRYEAAEDLLAQLDTLCALAAEAAEKRTK